MDAIVTLAMELIARRSITPEDGGYQVLIALDPTDPRFPPKSRAFTTPSTASNSMVLRMKPWSVPGPALHFIRATLATCAPE
ncbi:MAG: hypothetical protein ACHBMF_10655 [Chromatiales bacterium]